MIDINLRHGDVTWIFDESAAANYGLLDELNAMDFKDEKQALYAIRKWVLPWHNDWYFGSGKGTAIGLLLTKETCRFKLTKNIPFGAAWLPGIDGDAEFNQYSMEIYNHESPKFHLLLWNELFQEPFVKADLKQYRHRVDSSFERFPDFPEKWGEPEYKPWPFSLDV
jgi:hypothetical protein